jgi:hypothetical protein
MAGIFYQGFEAQVSVAPMPGATDIFSALLLADFLGIIMLIEKRVNIFGGANK